MQRHIQIIVASTREGRIGRMIADWAFAQASSHGGFDAEIVDLKEVALPLFDEPRHPRLGEYTHAHTKAWSSTVSRADGFVFVTPEYNHSYPAALKNALDYLNAEWRRKPVGFVSYGGVAAGTRAVEALLPVLACFEMRPVLRQVNIPFVNSLIHDGKFDPGDTQADAASAMFDAIADVLDSEGTRAAG